jgi:hypothetical protein
MRVVCLLMVLLVSPAAACSARSAASTAVLVELYTSAGCAACPQAERWLAGLPQRYAADRVIPVTLHVTRVAQPPRRLTALQRLALVRTPYVLLQGADFHRWHTEDFDREVARINGLPARAHLVLEVVAGRLKVRARASPEAPAAVFVGTDGPVEWHGPLALGEHELPFPAKAAVAFVQDRRTGEVLQTLRLGPCSPEDRKKLPR